MSFQIVEKVAGINQMNKELERRYIKEMKLRKRLHNELVDLKGNIRVYCRVRPFISEDGTGISSQTPTTTFDHSDDSVLNVINKGTTKQFEMEKVFKPTSTQDEVRVLYLLTSLAGWLEDCETNKNKSAKIDFVTFY